MPVFLHTLSKCLPNVTIDIKRVVLKDIPIKDERIDPQWLREVMSKYPGYTVSCLHLSRAQWKKAGLNPDLRGANPRRHNGVKDFYFWSDEKTKRKGFYQFVQTLLHELLHEYYQAKGGTDMTHQWHDENPDITVRFPINDIIKVL